MCRGYRLHPGSTKLYLPYKDSAKRFQVNSPLAQLQIIWKASKAVNEEFVWCLVNKTNFKINMLC